MNDELKSGVLGLLIPCDLSQQAKLLDWFETELAGLGASDSERASWLRAQLSHWSASGEASKPFKELIQRAIYVRSRAPKIFMFADAEDDAVLLNASSEISRHYFVVHANLMKRFLFSFDEAREFLSYAAYLIALATNQAMSASEISRVLGSRDTRFRLRWRAVRYVLERAKVAPVMEPNAFEQVFADQAASEPDLLADLTLEGTLGFAAETAAHLGGSEAIGKHLRVLLLESVHNPYICILHYQLMTLSFCDHAVTFAYEFSPRGQTAAFLTNRYNKSGISVAKNAFLNNAKALLRFDKEWVDGRSKNRAAAAALSAVLNALEGMAPLSKRELARTLLAILYRKLRISREKTKGGLPARLQEFKKENVEALLTALGAAGSSTSGIAEQRLVDCFGVTQHPRDGWVPRGLGDSVFAASLFRRKLGDAEFVNVKSDPPQLVGYESHGGHLSKIYVDDHFETFTRVLEKRISEFENVAPLANWRFLVIFVSHTFENGLPPVVPIITSSGPIDVTAQYLTFAELAQTLKAVPEQLDVLNELLVRPLNMHHIHPKVRERVRDLAT
jgi:hypothetical protein